MQVELIVYKAAAFYNFSPVLVPQQQSIETLSNMLRTTHAEILITSAGSISLQGLLAQHPALKQVIWVVEGTSRHMDWNEVPEGVGGNAEIAVWHDIIEERKSSVSTDFPADDPAKPPTNVITISQDASKREFEIVEFTQQVGLIGEITDYNFANSKSRTSLQLSPPKSQTSHDPTDSILPTCYFLSHHSARATR